MTSFVSHITVENFPLIFKAPIRISKLIFYCHATKAVVKLISSNILLILKVISFQPPCFDYSFLECECHSSVFLIPVSLSIGILYYFEAKLECHFALEVPKQKDVPFLKFHGAFHHSYQTYLSCLWSFLCVLFLPTRMQTSGEVVAVIFAMYSPWHKKDILMGGILSKHLAVGMNEGSPLWCTSLGF